MSYSRGFQEPHITWTVSPPAESFFKRSLDIFLFNLEDFVEFTLEALSCQTNARNGFIYGFLIGGVCGGTIVWRIKKFFYKARPVVLEKSPEKISEKGVSQVNLRKSLRGSTQMNLLDDIKIEIPEVSELENGQVVNEALNELEKQKSQLCLILGQNINESTRQEDLEYELEQIQGNVIKFKELMETHWPNLFVSAIKNENFDLASDLTTFASSHQHSSPSFETSSAIALQTLISIVPKSQHIRSRLEVLGLSLLDVGANPFGYQPPPTQENLSNEIENGEQEKEELINETPLELAIDRGYHRLVEKLLKHPLNPLKAILSSPPRDESLPTPLHKAIRANDLDILKVFLRSKSPLVDEMINRQDVNGKTILHLATEAKLVLVFPHILEDQRAKKFVNVQDKFGNTPLHYAAINKNMEMFHLLLREKGDPNITNYENESAYGIAIANGIDI